MSKEKLPPVTLADWKPSETQVNLVLQVVRSGRITYGDMSRRFEAMFAEEHHRKYAIFVNSGTSGLQVALHYLKDTQGWKDGDQVLVPAVTFVATVNTVLQNNLTPILVDVDPVDFNLNPDLIESKVNDRTRAVMPVDLLGRPAPITDIKAIIDPYKLKVVEDCCESGFVWYNGQIVGAKADIAVYSSYLAHIMSTGVGGMVTTNELQAERYMRSLIWHGRDDRYLDMDANFKLSPEELVEARFKFDKVGYSYRLTEMEAALGVGEIVRKNEYMRGRKFNAHYLYQGLVDQGLKQYMQLPDMNPSRDHAWMFFPVLFNDGIDRNAIAVYLEKKGIHTRAIMPLTNQPVYKNIFKEDQYPVAKKVNHQGLLLGTHPFLTKDDLDRTIDGVKSYFE